MRMSIAWLDEITPVLYAWKNNGKENHPIIRIKIVCVDETIAV